MVDVGPPGSIDEDYAHKPSLIHYRGDLYHFYCCGRREMAQRRARISVAPLACLSHCRLTNNPPSTSTAAPVT